MHVRIQIVMVADDGTEQRHEIVELTRTEASIETVRLTLAESKGMLAALQQLMVTHQVAAYLAQQRTCPHCGRLRPLKDSGTAPLRTLFGRVDVSNPRWQHCPCQPQQEHSFRPLATLLPERSSPELRYLETSWAADASYESAAKHLHDAFPLDQRHSAVTVRNHTLQAARRAEEALDPEQVMFMQASASPSRKASMPSPSAASSRC